MSASAGRTVMAHVSHLGQNVAVADGPETKYAQCADGGYVAYQAFGEGALDLICVGFGTLVSIDMRDEEPHLRRFERRLASFSRYIRFDPRGVGLSDPMRSATPNEADDGADDGADVVAVLDDIGSSRASVMAAGASGLRALTAAAAHPDRVSSLVLINCFATLAQSPDYPFGYPKELLDQFINAVIAVGGVEDESVDDIAMFAPSLAEDPDFRAWWIRAGQRSASPVPARAMLTSFLTADLRPLLPSVTPRALVIHRTDSFVDVAHSRYLADHLPNAQLVILPGMDHLPFAGDTSALLDEVEEFLTGVRGGSEAERVLTTVLFTDIVGSTERAVEIGDSTWHDLLDRHDAMVRVELRRFGGREVKTTGDGMLATFDSPARAMQCASAICTGARELDIEVRAGVHTGEVERRGDDVSGVAVHIAQRVSGLAEPSEVLVSRTVVDLVAGSGIEFVDRGEHPLKGISGAWRLFALVS